LQQGAIRREDPYGMVKVIRTVNAVIWTNKDTVGIGEYTFAPSVQEFPLTIKNNHWVRATIEGVDSIL